MTKASDNVFPRFLISEGGSTATPAAGQVTMYAKADGLLYSKDDAGAESPVSGGGGSGSITASGYTQNTARLLGRTTASAGAIEEITVGSGLSLSAGSITATGGAGLTGYACVVAPPYWREDTTSTNATAELAYSIPLAIAAPMKLEALYLRVTSSAAGSIQWGLFDCSSTPTACTKIAGGSAAPGGTGWQAIAAASAPVSVAAGFYVVIIRNATATPSTLARLTSSVSIPFFAGAHTTYTWDDTPDVTAAGGGWTNGSNPFHFYLVGNIDAAGTDFAV